MSRILSLFRKSPFEPLAMHMDKVQECIDRVPALFESVIEGDYSRLEKLTREIYRLEHDADKIKNRIRGTLPRGLFLPVLREDLLAYLKLQDDMADTAENVAVLMTMKKIKLPKSLAKETQAHVENVMDVCRATRRATDMLKDLVEVGFSGQRAEEALKIVAEAEHAEWLADKSQYALAKRLFACEKEMAPTDIFLWFKVFGELGRLANHAEKTGDAFRRMLIK